MTNNKWGLKEVCLLISFVCAGLAILIHLAAILILIHNQIMLNRLDKINEARISLYGLTATQQVHDVRFDHEGIVADVGIVTTNSMLPEYSSNGLETANRWIRIR